ncbi:codanin-1 [Galendromus occidentalis]|uniref:Codanin-1 n=1 Tax=Galendromus occidentalis TaxID=34638 RepID=A0AAJ6QXH8_9ACAR|nr:codanin-1 [Galendromus occidentalis]
MAHSLTAQLDCGRDVAEEILCFLNRDNTSRDGEELTSAGISAAVNEFLAFLRQQSRTAFEDAPNTAASVTPSQAKIVSQTSQVPQSQPELPPEKPNAVRPKRVDLQRILPAELTCKSPERDFVVSNDDFPSLGDTTTPIKSKQSSSGPLQSTPVPTKGNLEIANAPLVLEGIFNRSLPKSGRKRGKRASLISITTQTQPNLHAPAQSDSPKKRIAPIPVKRWQQASEENFISAQVSNSPMEAMKHQREVVRSINKETNVGQAESFDIPKMSTVSSVDVLERLAQLYARCICRNLVPNLFLELSFLMQLLVIRITERNSRSDILLGSASNCGYFAVQTISHCRPLLDIMEPSTLTLMKNIPHVAAMSSSLHVILCDLCSRERNFSLLRTSFLQGVSFDATVDSSENFPNTRLFGAFRKQRDAFYDLLKEWQKVTFSHHHKELDFNSRVAAIFDLSMDPCNLLHLAKLFALQMIATCCGNPDSGDLSSTSECTLRDLRNKCPEKFSELQSRLEKPGASSAGSTQHEFTGQQAFFYKFVLAASRAQFHEHLKNVLVSHIVEEDHFDVFPEDADTSIDSQVREELYTLLYRMRLYGAFLGLLEFLPYVTSSENNPQIIESQRSARQYTPPRIDVERLLRGAIEGKRLLPTLSWISTYLSMADTAVGSLPIFKGALDLLNTTFLSCEKSRPFFILVRLLIGWIFQNLHISVNFNSSRIPLSVPPEIEAFVDAQLIHMLCPFLASLKPILAEYYCMPTIEARKIVPLTRPDSAFEPNGVISKLEDAFYFGHSASVKKTLNFVVERVPANVVKSMKPVLVKQFREEVKKEIEELTRFGEEPTPQLMDTLSVNLCPRFQLKAENVIMPACDEKAAKLLDELLKAECTKEGMLVAKKLCARQYHVRILQWIRCHISKDYIHKEVKEVSANAQENSRDDGNDFENRALQSHCASASVNYIIDSLEELLRKILVGEIPSWRACLEETKRTMQMRKEWKPAPWEAVCRMLVDLGSLSIARYVDLRIVNAVIDILCEVNYEWGHHFVDSPRNQYIIEKFCDRDPSAAKKLLSDYQNKLNALEDSVP